MMTTENSFQHTFIRTIKESLPGNYVMADELAELLKISHDSAYRRIRCQTALTIDEVKRLCDHYKISFDSLSRPESDVVTFEYKPAFEETAFLHHLERLYRVLLRFKKTNGEKLVFVAEDIPIIHLFRYPVLAEFRIFYWLHALMNKPTLNPGRFKKGLITNELMETGQALYNLYTAVNTTEIWSGKFLDSLLMQIQFCAEAGHLDGESTHNDLFDSIGQMIEDLKLMVELGAKWPVRLGANGCAGQLNCYLNEVQAGNDCVFIKSGHAREVYLTHQTFNSLSTYNHAFCQETEAWIGSLTRKAVLISRISEKHRTRFFTMLHGKVNRMRKYLEREVPMLDES